MSAANLARIIAYSRDKSTVSDVVMKHTHYDDAEDAFMCPPIEDLKRMSVVIMTISTSGKNPNIGLKNHFTHVIVDEAGHVTEPEVAGCFGAAKKSAVIVLAGDPKQLGPIIRSEMAKSLGLEISLLERLSKCGPYERQNGTYDSRVCTKLVKNYRSHPSILKVPNEMFYNNDLVASADVFCTHAYQSWEHLPKEGFPIIFHGVEGEDRREGNSTSWFNSEEATIVKHYVELLVKGTRTNRCNPEDIGIVTPYHKQVQKIRQLMKAKSYDTKVGSVDEFQGSERRVIIISTVRSTVDHIQFDKKHRLGFVANEKRFNVAITRAQALLIVIGNPYVLQNDKNWCELIKFCKENGGYTGCEFELGKEDDIDTETDNALKGIASMKLDDEDSEDDDSYVNIEPISAMTALEQPEWRIEE
jgi:superfamily I DNA and/or RNA helicase